AGGVAGAGGTPPTGGARGGTTAPGGATAPGGSTPLGGATVTGGSPTGGAGPNPPPVIGNRVRQIMPFDASWLFNAGDATGADTTTFADTTWRSLSVPHDWAIEGTNPPANPFSATAATTGRGAWVASGIAWYRKHFTLPQSLSGDKIYVEFDAVMGNSTVYVNGTQIGNHPYGYVTFRYDITANVKADGTTDNVIAVKCDTSTQPAERFYAGAGIYRHVRLLATNPVHVDQWATYVQTPSPTTTSATVHVQTSVVNSGTTSQSVTVQGIVSGPDGTALTPVSAAAQTIAGGASASFTFDVTVANPKLWDPENPNMYSLLTNVQVGGTTVDDDVTPFGIRSLIFNNGLTLNGKSVKLAGTANHQDYHGLGLAAPARAMQRRIAGLKTTGSNAWRTAHDPPSPDFLDLTDRMGMLVLDEFTDVWSNMKYEDKGDYSMYFNKASTTPTGMPALPAAATSAKWWEVDFTGYIMRDRNHPSVALYSVGNEIHDSLASRTPILTEMHNIAHALDPSRYITQALLDPSTAGDTASTAQTASLLDVWGTNYNAAVCTQMEGSTATKSSMVTEDGTNATADWTTVDGNTGLTGIFLWAGVSYLGEVDGQTTKIGGGGGLMSSLGVISGTGNTWQGTWGATKTTFNSGAVAGKVTLTPDHTTLVADNNDCVFFMAAISGSAATPITFTISGPGNIIAVDSDSMGMESFRGPPWTRNAYNGVAYAIVQATGAGTITVTASATGLTAGSASVTASAGTWLPCSGTCD
ncbi:MAG: glycoside hydrolase family 2 TIM barrel-domain containing protein, partial [Polyangia bacterium]